LEYHEYMRRSEAIQVVLELADGQAGHLTRAQARAWGLDDLTLARLSADGIIERADHGVYRLPTASEDDVARIWVAWLRLDPASPAWERARDPDVVVSHRSAARVYELGVLPVEVCEFTVTGRARYQTRRPDVSLRRARLGSTEWEIVGGLPVTRPRRILADLMAAGEDGDHLGRIAVEALERHLATRTELIEALVSLAHHHALTANSGEELLERLLDMAGAKSATGS
jgi:hypothetical protein